MHPVNGERICPVCGTVLPDRVGPGRPRLFCSERCYYADYRKREHVRAYHAAYDAQPDQRARRRIYMRERYRRPKDAA